LLTFISCRGHIFVPYAEQLLNQNGIKYPPTFILWEKGLSSVRIAKKEVIAKENSVIFKQIRCFGLDLFYFFKSIGCFIPLIFFIFML